MKKIAIAFIIFASGLAAQVQLGKNVQIGAGAGTVTQVNTDSTSGISGGPITTTGTVACQQGSASQFGCVKADGTTITASGGVLTATGAGGSGVQYNPTTTSYIVSSFSGLYDDGDANSTSLGVPSSVSCVHTTTSTCTVAFGSAHGLSVGGAVDMFNLASWPYGQQAAQFGSFQVTTVPDSTHITFTTPTALTYTCSPCTGNIYDASYWGIWQFAKQPFIYGHGTVFGIETTTQNLATNFTSLTSSLVGTPTFLIDQTGQNDLSAGRTTSQIETDHQTVWAAAHTAGMTVMQTTMVPANYGVSPQGISPGILNYWYWSQRKTAATAANGQYYDLYADTASALNYDFGQGFMPEHPANVIFAQVLNEAFSTQRGTTLSPPRFMTDSVTAINGLGINSEYIGFRHFWFDDSWNVILDYASTLNAFTFNKAIRITGLTNQSCVGTDSNGQIQAGTCGGTTTNALTMNNSGTGDVSGSTFNGSAAKTISYNTIGAAPTASPTFTGTPDASGATQFKLPVSTTATTAANGEIKYDSTNNNWHAWVNGADTLLIPLASGFTTGHCGQPTLTGNTWSIQDAGGACGVSGGGSAFSAITTGTNTTATMTVGTGGSIARSGSGSIDASAIGGVTITGTPSAGMVPTATSSSAATWTTPSSGGNYVNIGGSVTWTGCTYSNGVCTVSGTTTTVVTISSIPGTYLNLKTIAMAQSSAGGNLQYTVNNDTATNYAANGIAQTSTNSPVANQAPSISSCPNPNIPSTGVLALTTDMPLYAGTTFIKNMHSNYATIASTSSLTNNTWSDLACAWNSTAAVTRVDYTISTGHIVAGTAFMIYATN